MTTDEENLAVAAHRRCSVLLRRWLSETHTPVRGGPLRLPLGPIRLHAEVEYVSPTGAHRFGPIRVVDAEDRPLAIAEPGLLSAALSAEARARAVADATINAADAGSLVDWALRSTGERDAELDPVGAGVRESTLHEQLREGAWTPPRILESVTDGAEAERWLSKHVETELLPRLCALESPGEEATASLLSSGVLAAIGVLGRCGVADERDLLAVLSAQLDAFTDSHPELDPLLRSWLTGPTVTDVAVVNGSSLRYRSRSGEIRPDPVLHEIANPLRPFNAASPRVPGVPLPELGEGWSLRPVELTGDDGGPDAALVHEWMNTEHVAVNWNQAWSREEWHTELATQLGGSHSLPCIVSLDGRRIAYVELYRVERDKLAGCYPRHPRDLGVHIAIGDDAVIGRGLGSSLLLAVARGLLEADPECPRVVAEPNVHNAASIAAFAKAGYTREREVGLPTKNSALMVHPR
ncbi:RimJ/RimL family protein N-acetyltransferase [Saccharopolyspora lacisalsi]|uniref:Lysine N-acyltransferase MbtK n=1 Tax=Halosaccharopolyspora lacisalsi TaxID=1000566 RepID=A0A839DWL5_9PSEU|nr:GNAT family N-acetyltransferase [Halosaccharopolyspora lacisalsi]MBA8825270.1 RimJ/RimL family protein N-acetyltransferase [Halosaccharopolyspora lacisalsi]